MYVILNVFSFMIQYIRKIEDRINKQIKKNVSCLLDTFFSLLSNFTISPNKMLPKNMTNQMTINCIKFSILDTPFSNRLTNASKHIQNHLCLS